MTINQVKKELPESPPFLPFLCPPCFVSLRVPGLLLLPPPLLPVLVLPLPEPLVLLLFPPPPLAFLRGAITRSTGAAEDLAASSVLKRRRGRGAR